LYRHRVVRDPVTPYAGIIELRVAELKQTVTMAVSRIGPYGDFELVQYYFEDFESGQTFIGSTRIRVDKEDIIRFAAEFDPQPFHLDEEAAKKTIFSGLAASGWHTSAMTMRLMVDSRLKVAGGLIGLGMEELRWPRPVRVGDELRVQSEVLDTRESKSRPQQGLVRVRNTTLNQRDEVVQVSVSTMIVPRRPAMPGK
jgi:acyl dehydratase